MPIIKRPIEEAAAVTLAGQQIGEATKVKRIEQINLQRQAQDAAHAWEIQKFVLNSQQDFAHEQRMRQADLDVEARAKEWEKEKMELASRLDFEQDERERLRHKEEYRVARDTLDEKKEIMPLEEYERALFRLDSIYAPKGVPDAVIGLGFDIKAERIPSVAEQRLGLLTPEQQREAALISAGLEPRVARPPTEYGRIKQIDELTKITASFEEDAEVDPPGWWNKKIVPLAVRDADGDLVEATPEETQLYKVAVDKLNRMVGITIVYPDFVTEEDKPKYDLLIQRGWTPDAIKTTLGK